MKENLKVEDLKKVLNDKANQAVSEIEEMIDSYKSAYHESKEKLEVMQEIETYTSNLEKLDGKVMAYIEIAKEFDIELDVEVEEEQREEENAVEEITEPTTEPPSEETTHKMVELIAEIDELINNPTQDETLDTSKLETVQLAIEPTTQVVEPLTEDFRTTTLVEPLLEAQESKEVIYELVSDTVAEEAKVDPIHIDPTIESDVVVDQSEQLTEEQIDEIMGQVEQGESSEIAVITSDELVVTEVQQSQETLEIAIIRILSRNLHKYSEKYNTPFDTISFLIFYNEDKKAIEFNLYILKRFVTKLALPSDILDDDDNISTLDTITELRKKLDAYCVEFNCEKQDVKVQLATTSNTDDTVYLALVIRSSFVRWIDIAECVQQAKFSQKF